ncbi:MAG TPA: hypothetical protein DDY49_13900 [Paenibacillaceae bacterium]|nr:hypothetical protein [Paenibacillaceae bacterium]
MNWNEDANQLLDELVKPIPAFVRPMAKKSIVNKVEHLAQEDGIVEVNQDCLIRGYILSSPDKDKEKVLKILQAKNIDLSPYQALL